MRQFAQRVNLVHELGKLGSTEELADNRLHRLRVNQRTRRRRGQIAVHTVARGFRHLRKPDTHLVFQKFPDAAHTAVTQVVNVVHFESKIVAVHFLGIFTRVERE